MALPQQQDQNMVNLTNMDNNLVKDVPLYLEKLVEATVKSAMRKGECQSIILWGAEKHKSSAFESITNTIALNLDDVLSERLLATQTIFTSFSNSNSSLHVSKYFKLFFDELASPAAAELRPILLEQTRIVHPPENEQNYDIFYQLLNGPEKLQKRFGIFKKTFIIAPRQYKDDNFSSMEAALATIGFTSEEIYSFWRILASILWIGQIQFLESSDSSVYFLDETPVSQASQLLQVEPSELRDCILSRTSFLRDENVSRPFNLTEATATRNGLCKQLYSRLFHYVLSRANDSLCLKPVDRSLFVGVLEVRGYENKKENGFEQFLENYVNEKIYQLSAEGQESLVCSLIEGSKSSNFSYKNNNGLLPLLDEMSQLQASDQQFLSRLFIEFKGRPGLCPPSYKDEPLSFTIEHFFDRVRYHCSGFCERNKDFIWAHIIKVLEQSKGEMVSNIFPAGSSNVYANKLPETVISKLQLEVAKLVSALNISRQHFVRFPLENVSVLLSPLLEEVEELNLLQLARSEQIDQAAILLQSVWRARTARREFERLKTRENAAKTLQRAWRNREIKQIELLDVYDLQKLRRDDSLEFRESGMYLDQKNQTMISHVVEDDIIFADEICKYNRYFKAQPRLIVLTNSHVYILSKGMFRCRLHAKIAIPHLIQVSLSVYQDNFFVLQHGPHEVLYSLGRKTEFLTKLAKLKKLHNHPLRICLSRSRFEYFIKSGRRRTVNIREEEHVLGSSLIRTGNEEALLLIGTY